MGGPITPEVAEETLVLLSFAVAVVGVRVGGGARAACTERRRAIGTLRGSAAGVTGPATFGVVLVRLRLSKLSSCCFADLSGVRVMHSQLGPLRHPVCAC